MGNLIKVLTKIAVAFLLPRAGQSVTLADEMVPLRLQSNGRPMHACQAGARTNEIEGPEQRLSELDSTSTGFNTAIPTNVFQQLPLQYYF